MEELDIEVRLGFYAKNLEQAKEAWEAIQEAMDGTDGISPYAAEAEIISQLPNGLPHDLDEAIKKMPQLVLERIKGD